MDEINQAIEAARQELAMLQAEIDTLRARKSVIECIRETFAQEQPVSVLKRKKEKYRTILIEQPFEKGKKPVISPLFLKKTKEND